MGKGKISVEKTAFSKRAEYFSAEENNIKRFKSKIFPTKNSDKIPTPEPKAEPTVFATTNPKKGPGYKSKVHVDFWNTVANDETDVNTEIFNQYFKYQNPEFLLRDFFNTSKTKNDAMVNHINDAFIDLRNAVSREETPQNPQF